MTLLKTYQAIWSSHPISTGSNSLCFFFFFSLRLCEQILIPGCCVGLVGDTGMITSKGQEDTT
eukprot:m.33561 g.33561  ORF g.33561 m.33561 type:complete len:63 (-) comp6455_c2_seq1:490-678(-)